MAKIIVTALRSETLLGLIGEGDVEFIATDRKGKILGVKKLRGVLNQGAHSFNIGGTQATVVTASLGKDTICEWKRA